MARKKAGNRGVGLSDREIGIRLRALRIDNKMSQDALGRTLGVTFQQIQKYEKGVNRLSLTRAIHVAKILKTTVEQIAGNDGSKDIVHGPSFNLERYRLAQSFENLDDDVVPHFRRLIEAVKKGNGKKR